MNIRELTAPCGIDCFNCQIHESNITEAMKNQFAQTMKKDPSEIPCAGCRPKEGKCMLFIAGTCETYKCVTEHGVEFCYECSDFPCTKLAPCSARADKLPHNMKVYNLCMIKKMGLEKWAEESKMIRKRYYEGEFVIGGGPRVKD